MITYSYQKQFTEEQIYSLFHSVGWESAQYAKRIVKGLQNSSLVISAWEDGKLIGLVRAMDDGQTIAFVHYLLIDPCYQSQHVGSTLMKKVIEQYKDILYIKIMPSDPKTIPFYQKLGFTIYDNYTAMMIKHFK